MTAISLPFPYLNIKTNVWTSSPCLWPRDETPLTLQTLNAIISLTINASIKKINHVNANPGSMNWQGVKRKSLSLSLLSQAAVIYFPPVKCCYQFILPETFYACICLYITFSSAHVSNGFPVPYLHMLFLASSGLALLGY